MDRESIVAIIVKSVLEHSDAAGTEIGPETALFGDGGLLDSMGLVNVTLDVEASVADETGITITLADDRAMSQRNSPFRTVNSLADYAAELLAEQNASA